MEFKPEIWEQVKTLFEAALRRRPETRSQFVELSCRDPVIRREVGRLLENHRQMGSFLSNHEPDARSGSADSELPTAFQTGQLLAGRFRIKRLIACGGMGEVYEARDFELDTSVAIKTIRADLLSENLLQRFRAEVQLARQITHPNICRVHDLFRHSSDAGPAVFFISMELLSGETLAKKLRRVSRLNTREALSIVRQISSALQAAHEKGILHRDLKPENVMLVPAEHDVRAVVMDFGIALRAADSIQIERHPEPSRLTGTPAYMSPEQLEGRELTSSSDIYALGLLMYRMVTGIQAFEDDTTTAMALRRLSELPAPPRNIVSDLDHRWVSVILKCLEPEPSRRYSSVRSVVDALYRKPTVLSGRPAFYLSLVLTLLSVATAGFVLWSGPGQTLIEHQLKPRVEYTQLTNDGRPKEGGLLTNGQVVFYTERVGAHRKLMSVPVAGGDALAVPVPLENPWLVDISTDGAVLLLQSNKRDEQRLWAYPVSGGAPRLLITGRAKDCWLPQDRDTDVCSVLSAFRIDRKANIDLKTLPGIVDTLTWSPDGRRLRFVLRNTKFDSISLWESQTSEKRAYRLVSFPKERSGGSGVWTRDEKYFFYETGTPSHQQLWVMPEAANPPGWHLSKAVQVTDGAGSWSFPAISPLHPTLFAFNEVTRSELERLDAKSLFWKSEMGIDSAYELDFSRDGKWMSYTQYPNHTIWKARPDGSEPVRLTDERLEAHQPHWSPDGRRIAFMAKKLTGEWRVFWVPSSGGISEELLPNGDDQGVPTWSPDGHFLMFGDLLYRKPNSRMSIHLLNLESRDLREVPDSQGLWSPRWSPNGKYIAALAADSRSLLVTCWPDLKWREVAAMPYIDNATWSADSRYIYFSTDEYADPRMLYRVSIPRGRLDPIADLRNFPPSPEVWFGVRRDGTPLAFHVTSVKEIWALKYILP